MTTAFTADFTIADGWARDLPIAQTAEITGASLDEVRRVYAEEDAMYAAWCVENSDGLHMYDSCGF